MTLASGDCQGAVAFLPATYKLHDFHLGSRPQHGAGPVGLFEDAAVQFDGHARRFQLEVLQELQNRLSFHRRVRLAVEYDLHVHCIG
jgi:hypothetical protein